MPSDDVAAETKSGEPDSEDEFVTTSSDKGSAGLPISFVSFATGTVTPPSAVIFAANKSPLPDRPSRNASPMVSLSSKKPVMIDDPSA